MNLNTENEQVAFKRSTLELDEGIKSMASILNKHGSGVLYFGVNNNGDVVGQQCSETTTQNITNRIFESLRTIVYPEIEILNDSIRRYIKVTFSGKSGSYSAFGKYYLRVGDEDKLIAPKKLRTLFSSYDIDNSQWEKLPSNETINDVDEKILKDFYDRGKVSGRISFPYSNKKDVLNWLNLIAPNGKLNNAGRVLFSKNKPLKIKMASYATDDRVTFLDMDQEEGNIYELIGKAMDLIKKNVHWRQIISSGPREEKPEIPLLALKEVVINSFCHEIFNNSVTNEIDIYPSKVEIFNPGRVPEGFVPEDFAFRNIKAIQVNPIIANVMFLGHDIEGYGGGFKRVFDICKENNIAYNYQITIQGFSFFFMREEAKIIGIQKPLTKESIFYDDIMKIMKSRDDLQGKELSELLDVNLRAMQRTLVKMEKEKLIKRKGSGRWTKWVLKSPK